MQEQHDSTRYRLLVLHVQLHPLIGGRTRSRLRWDRRSLRVKGNDAGILGAVALRTEHGGRQVVVVLFQLVGIRNERATPIPDHSLVRSDLEHPPLVTRTDESVAVGKTLSPRNERRV